MKKIIKGLLAIVMMITLTACSPDQRAYKKYSGTWVLKDAQVQDDDTATNAIAAAIAVVRLFGGEITLDLHDDGTGTFGIGSETSNVTWNAEAVTVDDRQFTYTVKDGKMTLNISDTSKAILEKKNE